MRSALCDLRSACAQNCSQRLLYRAQVPMSLQTQLTVAGLSIAVLIVGSTFVGVFWCRCPNTHELFGFLSARGAALKCRAMAVG